MCDSSRAPFSCYHAQKKNHLFELHKLRNTIFFVCALLSLTLMALFRAFRLGIATTTNEQIFAQRLLFTTSIDASLQCLINRLIVIAVHVK